MAGLEVLVLLLEVVAAAVHTVVEAADADSMGVGVGARA
jgi:hypothetical protein